MSNEEKLFYSIGEVAEILQLKPYVLRYWETEFKKLNPQKSFAGQRTYRARDIQLALTIKKLLYDDKYTIAGAIQKLNELDEKGELVGFSNDATVAPAASTAPVEEKSETTQGNAETTTAAEPPKPKVDGQKVKDLKTLLEATKKLLKKYNLQ